MSKSETVKRKVYFYRGWFESGDGNRSPLDGNEITTAIREYNQNTFGRLPLDDSRSICAWADEGGHGRIVLGMSRNKGLPHIEDGGKLSPLPLGRSQGLSELSHLVIFPEGIIGAEYNFYGPRIFKLRDYLSDCLGMPLLRIDSLTDRNVSQMLKDLQTITMVKIRLHKDTMSMLSQSVKSLADAFEQLQDISDAPVVEVTLKQEARERASLGKKTYDFVTSIVGPALVREAADELQVRGLDARSGKTRTFDFLRDKFAYATEVVLLDERYRTVNSEDMFIQIVHAYNAMRGELMHAAGIEI